MPPHFLDDIRSISKKATELINEEKTYKVKWLNKNNANSIHKGFGSLFNQSPSLPLLHNAAVELMSP